MSSEPIHRITELALKEFTSVLCCNRDHSWWPNRGKPPGKGYVEQKLYSREPCRNDPAIAAWTIENYQNITKIEPFARALKPAIDGMFFDCLIGSWGVSDDFQNLSVHWQTGPRFGRGFICPILESPTGILYLGRRIAMWAS